MIYLDTSAALKLVLPEPESAALELWLAERPVTPRISSRLLRIELLRTVNRYAAHRISRAQTVLASIHLLSIDDVVPAAESIGDPTLRSLDAIHLATAHALRTEVTSFVSYDKRLMDEAARLGLPVTAPS